jgi:hypothetical protein
MVRDHGACIAKPVRQFRLDFNTLSATALTPKVHTLLTKITIVNTRGLIAIISTIFSLENNRDSKSIRKSDNIDNYRPI